VWFAARVDAGEELAAMRHELRSWLRDDAVPDLIADNTVLAAHELAANALDTGMPVDVSVETKHSAGGYDIYVTTKQTSDHPAQTVDDVLLAVQVDWDQVGDLREISQSPDRPADDERGRGLMIVSALSATMSVGCNDTTVEVVANLEYLGTDWYPPAVPTGRKARRKRK
jgi:anti-sigma regulatory factor (Ser/Thr protein kinase)